MVSCSPKIQTNPNLSIPSAEKQWEYNNLSSWAAHPLISDPSDSMPSFLKKPYPFDSSAAVFFVHPTTYTNRDPKNWNADLSNSDLNMKTDRSTILFQASAFNEFLVYAPRYRQAHIRSYYTTDTSQALEAFEIAYSDVKSAFQVFLQQIGPNKPFFLASHSQGSTHTIRLISELIDGKPLQSRLIAAYVIGMYIPDNFQSIQMCKDSISTGCLVGWRS
jgi:hypothetical protein